jgi:hypothetical protein
MPPDPLKLCEQLQILRTGVSRLCDQHEDSGQVSSALKVVLESLRFAWYSVHGDSYEADAMLEHVESAIAKYRGVVEPE